ncbi:MAG: hypothetical protein ACLFSQ_11415 [Candidatus Zixiibacteriota bacterium]
MRSPIEDYTEVYPNEPLSFDYVKRIDKYKCGMHHIRYAGWLSNRTKKEQLAKFGIEKAKRDNTIKQYRKL